MIQIDAVIDHLLLSRLQALGALLEVRLGEAEDLRARLTKARDANVWPDMRLATQILVDANRPAN